MTNDMDIPGCEDIGFLSDDGLPLDDDAVARMAHSLAHPARIAIVRYLAAQDGCVAGEIFEQFDLAQSTVSQHLRVLREAGIVHATIHGNRTYYCMVPSALVKLEREIEELIAEGSLMARQTDMATGRQG